MCVFCDHRSLQLLVAPLDDLAPGQLAQAVRAAREAAHVGMLNHAEAVLEGLRPRGELEPVLYADVVVARAEEAGILDHVGTYRWSQRLDGLAGLRDPRVQSFLACGAEVVDEYQRALPERQRLLGRFLEVPVMALRFSHIGDDGEMWFDYGREAYAALRRHEAVDVVEREVARDLHAVAPNELLRYTQLPETATNVLAAIQKQGQDEANAILAGLIDLPALAADRVRGAGFAPFFRHTAEHTPATEATEFGDWILLHETH